jgi:hypothetical protein
MSNERDQVRLQRHIKEAEDRATAGGHELGPWQPASLSGLYHWVSGFLSVQPEQTFAGVGRRLAGSVLPD